MSPRLLFEHRWTKIGFMPCVSGLSASETSIRRFLLLHPPCVEGSLSPSARAAIVFGLPDETWARATAAQADAMVRLASAIEPYLDKLKANRSC
jgi:hypothetical protein